MTPLPGCPLAPDSLPIPVLPLGVRHRPRLRQSGLSRGCAQRVHRRLRLEGLVDDAVQALNALDGARAGLALQAAPTPPETNDGALGPRQRAITARLASNITEVGAPPADLKPDEALGALLRSDDDYTLDRAGPLGSFDFDRVRVCKGDLVPKEIETVVSEQAAVYARDPDRYIVKSDADIAADALHGGTIPA